MRIIGIVAGTVAATLVAVAIVSSGDGGEPAPRLPEVETVSNLRSFGTCSDVRDWARDELAPRVGAYGISPGAFAAPDILVDEDADDAAEPADEALADAEIAEAAPSDAPLRAAGEDTAAATSQGVADGDDSAIQFSETNVQVENVDEPDLVKTDGERILVVAGNQVHLTSAAEGELLSSVDLPDGMHDGELLLAGDRAVVFAPEAFEIFDMPGGAEIGRPGDPLAGAQTPVAQIDIAGDELVVSDVFTLEGSYISARMSDGVVRMVLHADPQHRLGFVTPTNPSPEGEERARRANQELVEDAPAEDFLPRWRRVDDDGDVVDEGVLVECEQAHAPERFAGFGMVTVVSIDLADGIRSGIASANGAGVMASGQTVYASRENLYVAAPAWPGAGPPVPDDGRDIGFPGVVDGDLGTDIHRFDISDPRQASYEMSGHVEGRLLNQFAMDEHEGNLRVATTTGMPGFRGQGGDSESHVFVLEPRDGVLREIGAVSELGPGESIFAVRFIGDVGYVVTFEQIDPLFTLDLSDPTQPTVRGELKIPGFSSYLHPIAEGWLVGVGEDVDESTGVPLGTQVSLFDVRDLDAPDRVAQVTVPDSSSPVRWDHRAFLWWPETELAALPISSHAVEPFDGLVGYTVDVDATSLDELGRIVHPASDRRDIRLSGPDEPDWPVDDDVLIPEIIEQTTPIQRSLVIDDEIWAVSEQGLSRSDLSTLGSTSFVPFG